MQLYTVISRYFATGEGLTVSVWIGIASDRYMALSHFTASIPDGQWWANVAVVLEGIPDDDVIDSMVTRAVKEQLLDERCSMRTFHAQLHANYA